jgi:hypothetical protein
MDSLGSLLAPLEFAMRETGLFAAVRFLFLGISDFGGRSAFHRFLSAKLPNPALSR